MKKIKYEEQRIIFYYFFLLFLLLFHYSTVQRLLWDKSGARFNNNNGTCCKTCQHKIWANQKNDVFYALLWPQYKNLRDKLKPQREKILLFWWFSLFRELLKKYVFFSSFGTAFSLFPSFFINGFNVIWFATFRRFGWLSWNEIDKCYAWLCRDAIQAHICQCFRAQFCWMYTLFVLSECRFSSINYVFAILLFLLLRCLWMPCCLINRLI